MVCLSGKLSCWGWFTCLSQTAAIAKQPVSVAIQADQQSKPKHTHSHTQGTHQWKGQKKSPMKTRTPPSLLPPCLPNILP